MRIRYTALIVTLSMIACLLLTGNGLIFAGSQKLPVPGTVTMIDLGAKKCIPCKMMAPIMDELEKEYKDRAAIIFIDVWENPDAARKFGINTIPTQIFYDAEGKEMLRHIGFFDKKGIIAELQKLGVK